MVLDRKTHYTKILDEMKRILDKYEKYKDYPEEFIDYGGEKLGENEQPTELMAYAKLIKDIAQFADDVERKKIINS